MNGRIVFSLLLSLAAARPCFAQSGVAKFSAADVRADFHYLYETLAASHYNLYVNTPKKVFDKEFTRIDRSIQDSLTALQINRLFQPFVAMAKLGHCVTGYPFKSYNAFLGAGGRVFPFDVRINDQRLYVTGNHSQDATIRPGDEILAIYNVASRHWLDGMYKYLSGEDPYFKNTLIDLVGFPRLYWMVYDRSSVFSVKIKKGNGQIVYVSDAGVLASDYREIRNRQRPLFTPTRTVSVTGDVAYLRPGQFLNAEAAGNTSNHQTFDKGEFFRFVDSAFVLIRAKKAKQLVLDLRGNPGGDNSFSDHLLAYFATRPFAFNSSFTVKTSPVTKRFWQDVNEPALANLKANILTRKDGEVFKVETPLEMPRTDSLRFTGNVYALIDRYTYSNATTVAAQIQDYRFGQLVGEQTAESPTLYAAVHEFELPRTKIGVTYPKAFMVRPNGDKSLKGVMPNFPVSEDALTSEDEVLAWTLNHIRESSR